MASNYTQPINIGNPVEHTIEGILLSAIFDICDKCDKLPYVFFVYLLSIQFAEFAIMICDLIGVETSKIKTMPAVEDDPQRRKPDISRAKKYLNWEPRIPLKVGLEKTIRYFRKELERSKHSNRNIYVPNQSPSNANTVNSKDSAPIESAIENVISETNDVNVNGNL